MEDKDTLYQHPWVILKLEYELYGLAAPIVKSMV